MFRVSRPERLAWIEEVRARGVRLDVGGDRFRNLYLLPVGRAVRSRACLGPGASGLVHSVAEVALNPHPNRLASKVPFGPRLVRAGRSLV